MIRPLIRHILKEERPELFEDWTDEGTLTDNLTRLSQIAADLEVELQAKIDDPNRHFGNVTILAADPTRRATYLASSAVWLATEDDWVHDEMCSEDEKEDFEPTSPPSHWYSTS